MPITRKLTTLGSLRAGDLVNLESSLRVGDELGGHFVLGHVDGVGTIASLSSRAKPAPLRSEASSTGSRDLGTLVSIKIPPSLTRFIVPRGSIAVDGVSLTIVSRRGNVFTISLVDYTLRHTTLGSLRVGDRVNIEIDSLARYAFS